MNTEDTIVALATPPGRGAIAVIRMSGPNAAPYADHVFTPAHGVALSTRPSHTATFGILHDTNTSIDSIIALTMWSPHSYTGEDTVEFFCHGGPVITQRALKVLTSVGARPAQPGEFTRRAFLNGKIDLTQAEAVADMINAPTERTRRAALAQLLGSLSASLTPAHDALVAAHAHIEAHIDFMEDVDAETCIENAENYITKAQKHIAQLQKYTDTGRILHDGFRAVITGPPNVGKSCILNLLAQEERALVTDIPGTTRDTLEVDVNMQGWPVRFIDTAGMRESADTIEQHGIARAHKMIEQSDLVILVHDISVTPPENIEEEIEKSAKTHPLLCVWNKNDLPVAWPRALLRSLENTYPHVYLSALTGEGLDTLHTAIVSILSTYEVSAEDSVFVMRERHRELIESAANSIDRALKALTTAPPELTAQDLRDAIIALSEVMGTITTEDILDHIFADFCIGK